MNGKTVVVTGANSGIGLETALDMSRRGATVIAACRNPEKGNAAVDKIRRESGNADVVFLPLDLADLNSVREAAKRLLTAYESLDILINNAGLITTKRELSADGFELQFATNHLGPFLFTNLLLPLLKASPEARIITVSSGAHVIGKIHFEDLMLEKRFGSFRSYSQSKLANILFTRSLARRLEATKVHPTCLHPGFVNSGFATSRKTNRQPLAMRLISPFSVSPAKGAQTSIFLAINPAGVRNDGEYFIGNSPAKTSKIARNPAIAEKLWQVSCELTGLDSIQ